MQHPGLLPATSTEATSACEKSPQTEQELHGPLQRQGLLPATSTEAISACEKGSQPEQAAHSHVQHQGRLPATSTEAIRACERRAEEEALQQAKDDAERGAEESALPPARKGTKGRPPKPRPRRAAWTTASEASEDEEDLLAAPRWG